VVGKSLYQHAWLEETEGEEVRSGLVIEPGGASGDSAFPFYEAFMKLNTWPVGTSYKFWLSFQQNLVVIGG